MEAHPSAIDPERCDLDEAVEIWPRPGENAHRLRKRWRTAIEKAGGRVDLTIAVNALAAAWVGASVDERQFAPSMRTWLDEERFREGADQQGPRPARPTADAVSRPVEHPVPPVPAEIPWFDPGGRRLTEAEHAAVYDRVLAAWHERHGIPA